MRCQPYLVHHDAGPQAEIVKVVYHHGNFRGAWQVGTVPPSYSGGRRPSRVSQHKGVPQSFALLGCLEVVQLLGRIDEAGSARWWTRDRSMVGWI